MTDIINHRPLKKDEKICSCCGSIVPSPTEPGIWEYLEMPKFAIDMAEAGEPHFLKWQRVSVVPGKEEGLNIIPDGEAEPIWWPNQAAWRKIK